MRAMRLSDYVDYEPGLQTDLARRIGCQPQLVWQWARGVRPVPIGRCVPIERATAGAVRRWDLRPDDWDLIWPELIDTSGAPPVPASRAAAAA